MACAEHGTRIVGFDTPCPHIDERPAYIEINHEHHYRKSSQQRPCVFRENIARACDHRIHCLGMLLHPTRESYSHKCINNSARLPFLSCIRLSIPDAHRHRCDDAFRRILQSAGFAGILFSSKIRQQSRSWQQLWLRIRDKLYTI